MPFSFWGVAFNIRDMQRFTANMTGNAERRILKGKSYLVAPVSMIVPGVLAGSKGSLHYPQDMVARNAGRWENIPLTLGHPSDPLTNTPQSASDPGVVDRVGLGFVHNDRFATGKHRAEAWFDEDATRRKAPDVYAALNNGQRMEVSTGLFTQEEARDGTWNGRAYTHVVRGYQPDHLAILPNQRGACSVNDGCGLNVYNAATNNSNPEGVNQYTSGGFHATAIKAREMSREAHETSTGTKGEGISAKAVKISEDTHKSGLGIDIAKAHEVSIEAHMDAHNEHQKLRGSDKENSQIHDIAAQEHRMAADAHEKAMSYFNKGRALRYTTNTKASTKTPKPLKAATVGSPEAASRVQAYIENDGEQPSTPPPTTSPGEPKVDLPPATGPVENDDIPPPQSPNPPASEPQPKKAPVGNDGCPCGGTCRNCMAKNAVTEPLADDQPRCPIKQTFQPKGFKGKGRGEAHTAAKAGMSDTGIDADTGDKETDVTTKPGVTVQNSNPEGINQYSHGGGGSGSKSEKEAAILHATKDMHSSKSLGTKAAAKSSQLAAMKGTPAAHVEAMQHHARLAEKHESSGNAEKAAAHHSIAQLHHDAALTTNQPTNNDRSSGQTTGESDMDRKAMIQHLTTNCDCYKGKHGAVLNSMTTEQIEDLIANAEVVKTARELVGNSSLTTNAMPAALKAAMDKKKGGDAAPDEEDDDDDTPPTKNSAPAAKPTLEQHLQTLPREVRNLVRNALATERRQKEEYVEVLTANVEGDAKQVLANHYLKLPVDALKAQVDALPQQTQNTGEYEFDTAPVYNAAALSGYDRGANNTRRGGVGEVMLDD